MVHTLHWLSFCFCAGGGSAGAVGFGFQEGKASTLKDMAIMIHPKQNDPRTLAEVIDATSEARIIGCSNALSNVSHAAEDLTIRLIPRQNRQQHAGYATETDIRERFPAAERILMELQALNPNGKHQAGRSPGGLPTAASTTRVLYTIALSLYASCKVPDGDFIETGVFNGGTAIAMLKVLGETLARPIFGLAIPFADCPHHPKAIRSATKQKPTGLQWQVANEARLVPIDLQRIISLGI